MSADFANLCFLASFDSAEVRHLRFLIVAENHQSSHQDPVATSGSQQHHHAPSVAHVAPPQQQQQHAPQAAGVTPLNPVDVSTSAASTTAAHPPPTTAAPTSSAATTSSSQLPAGRTDRGPQPPTTGQSSRPTGSSTAAVEATAPRRGASSAPRLVSDSPYVPPRRGGSRPPSATGSRQASEAGIGATSSTPVAAGPVDSINPTPGADAKERDKQNRQFMDKWLGRLYGAGGSATPSAASSAAPSPTPGERKGKPPGAVSSRPSSAVEPGSAGRTGQQQRAAGAGGIGGRPAFGMPEINSCYSMYLDRQTPICTYQRLGFVSRTRAVIGGPASLSTPK